MSDGEAVGIRCAACGYDLFGLASDAVCPECGLTVAASERPPGSPWQRKPGLTGLALTARDVIVRPRDVARDLRPSDRTRPSLSAWSLLIVWLSMTWSFALPPGIAYGYIAFFLVASAVFTGVLAVGLMVWMGILNAITRQAILRLPRQHEHAWQAAVDHAAVIWPVAFGAQAAGVSLLLALDTLNNRPAGLGPIVPLLIFGLPLLATVLHVRWMMSALPVMATRRPSMRSGGTDD